MDLNRLDYYALLEIPPGADEPAIERSYRFAMENYGHGALAAYGLLGVDESESIVKLLAEARRTLLDPRLRAGYDRKLKSEGRYAGVLFSAVAEPPPPQAAPKKEETANAPVEEILPSAAAAAVPETKPAKDRGWWPFSDKPEAAPPPLGAAEPPPPPTAPPPAPAVPAGTLPALDGRVIGGTELRQIREARGLTLEAVSGSTKISMSNIRFIEASNFAFLPASVYMKGFLRTLAKVYQIDAEKVISDYMRTYDTHRKG